MTLSFLLSLSPALAATPQIDDARDRVVALSSSDRRDAVQSVAYLTVSDPYTRASMQVPLALQAVVAPVDPATVPRAAQADWSLLQEQLATYLAVLDALEVDLQAPVAGDALGGVDPDLLIDRRALAGSRDPLERTARLVEALPEVARAVPAWQMASITHHNEQLEQTTGVERPCPRGPWAVLPGHSWTLGLQLGEVASTLERLEPRVEGAPVHTEVVAMRSLLQAWQRRSLE